MITLKKDVLNKEQETILKEYIGNNINSIF